MGNQLVASVKTVIRPIDYYLNELPEYKLYRILGQTQFLKVALCTHQEGDVVVKVLSHEDPSLLLEQYRKELLEFTRITADNLSIVSFQIAEVRPNFAYIVRQFVRYSLYDRLTTRPFLNDLEKTWIVYQIFKCMDWCHRKNICHGDIKLENILITSFLWITITDFAFFKPITLPEDNPLFFNYYFDISRRRCCNIAPERFIPSSLTQIENIGLSNPNSPTYSGSSSAAASFNQEPQLTPKMDMFSIGCALAEFFSDDVLFDLSGLLLYKEKRNDRFELSIKKIQNNHMQEIITNLVSLDPIERKSCKEILAEYSGTLFFKFFEPLFEFMKTLIRLPPDAKILFLKKELNTILPVIVNENPAGVLLLWTQITSSIRNLKHIHCKIEAQRLLRHLVEAAPGISSMITDRLIPYLVECLNDSDHRVRGESIVTITDLLDRVHRLPTSENNIFTDYLLDIFIKSVSAEKSIYVRTCMAKSIGRLSKIALNFLNQSCDRNYDEELKILHKYFQNLVSLLITDPSNSVRRILLLTPNNSTQLCTFFGRKKTNEVILSHIITFLNDKNDFHLRLSFFNNIVVIVSYLGIQCSTILHPLLQQGLCDAEEMIISVTIMSIASLTEQGLLHKNIIFELFTEMVPLLFHPNQWIVNSLVHFISILANHLSLIDLNCKIVPILRNYLNQPHPCLANKLLIAHSINSPLSRTIYEILAQAKDSDVLVTFFEKMKRVQSSEERKMILSENPIYKRLCAENLTLGIEEQIILLHELMVKINRNKRNYLSLIKNNDFSECIVCKNYDIVKSREIILVDTFGIQDNLASSGNQEWQHMFGPNSKPITEPVSISTTQEAKEVDYLLFECPPFTRDVRIMIQHKKNNFNVFHPVTVSMAPLFKPKGFLMSHIHEHKSSVNQLARFGETNQFVTCSDDGTVRLWDVCDDECRYVINRSKHQFRMEFTNGSPINFKGIISCECYLITYTNDNSIHVFELCDSCIVFLCSFKVGYSRSSVPVMITSICALSNRLFAVSITDSTVYGYDTRYLKTEKFCIPIFKIRVPPVQRTIMSTDGCEMIVFAATSCGYIAGFDLRFQLKVNNFTYEDRMSVVSKIRYTEKGLLSSVYSNYNITLWDYKLGQKDKVMLTANKPKHESLNTESTYAILPAISGNTFSVISGGSDRRIRYWDLTDPEQSFIISDPKYPHSSYYPGMACKYPSSLATSSSSPKSAKTLTKPVSPKSPPSKAATTKSFKYGGGIFVPLTNYTHRQANDYEEIVEKESSSTIGSKNQKSVLDLQCLQAAHHDTITDLLQVNNYLISSGRNGTVKIWR